MLLLFFLVIILIYVVVNLLYWRFYNETESFINIIDTVETSVDIVSSTNTNSVIPKFLWFFWDGEPTEFVSRCIDSWRKYNPTYTIHLLNKENIDQYLPDVKIGELRHANDSLARYSDYVRLNILSRYGGVWIDASSICHRSLDWIHSIQQKYKVDMIGFYLEGFTTPEYKETSPIIESWFFACTPNSTFVKDWCSEFMKTNDFETIDQYLEYAETSGCNFQKISIPNYLTIHVAAQVILQKNPSKYHMCVLSAEKGPYQYLVDVEWNSQKAVENLVNDETRFTYYKLPFIKLRSNERPSIQSLPSYDKMFS